MTIAPVDGGRPTVVCVLPQWRAMLLFLVKGKPPSEREILQSLSALVSC